MDLGLGTRLGRGQTPKLAVGLRLGVGVWLGLGVWRFGCGLRLGAGVGLRVAGERLPYDRSILIVICIPTRSLVCQIRDYKAEGPSSWLISPPEAHYPEQGLWGGRMCGGN